MSRSFRRSAHPPDEPDGYELVVEHGVRGEAIFHYGEGDHALSLFAETTAWSSEYSLWRDDLDHWDPPHEAEKLTDADKARVMANLERGIWHELRTRVLWEDRPKPLKPPPPEGGTLWWTSSDAAALVLSTSLQDPEQLRHLWALLGNELSRQWRLDTFVVRKREHDSSVWFEDLSREVWDPEGEAERGGLDFWPQAWVGRRNRRSPYYETVVHPPGFPAVYQLIAN